VGREFDQQINHENLPSLTCLTWNSIAKRPVDLPASIADSCAHTHRRKRVKWN